MGGICRNQMARLAIKSSNNQITESSDRLPSPMDTPRSMDTNTMAVVEIKWLDWQSNHQIIKSPNHQTIKSTKNQIIKSSNHQTDFPHQWTHLVQWTPTQWHM